MQRRLMTAMAMAMAVAVAGLASGCANLPKPNWFGKAAAPATALPSPAATVASGAKVGGQPKMPADESATPLMEIARGRGFERAGQYDKARKVYESLRERDPGNLDAAHRLGCVADSQRRHGEAEQLFLAVLAKDPKNSEVLGDLGYCYFLQGKLPQAEQTFRAAIAADPAAARHHNNLGLTLGHLDREGEAMTEFRVAGTEADAWYNMAFVYASRDQAEQAKLCFRRSLAVDPTHRRSRDALASFEDYERKPKALREAEVELASDGRYVPYIEGGDKSEVQQAAAELPAARDAGRAVRQLQLESRGLQNRSSLSQNAQP